MKSCGREPGPKSWQRFGRAGRERAVSEFARGGEKRRQVGFLGKAEYLQGAGLIGWIKRLWFGEFGGMIPVDRSDARAAARSLELAEEHLAKGGAFGIYPEGTRSRDGMLHKGRTGVGRLAAATGAVVIPCGLTGTDKVQPVGASGFRPHRVTVRFGPPVDVDYKF